MYNLFRKDNKSSFPCMNINIIIIIIIIII